MMSLIKKTRANIGEQSCRKGDADSFRNIMELAHNICLPQLDRIRNLKDKMKDLELSAHYWGIGKVPGPQILFNWSLVRN